MIKEMKTLKKFDLNNIDKSKWESFPFEKIAFRIAETVNPNTTELEIYYGLEHLDSESVHIRRNGTPNDVSGGKLKCYPGDIIFGKRRAYQRKAGIVKEAGICSAHSFVFRADEEVIDKRLLPFFLHSDQFMHKMVDISVGGLSPTINWSDLKNQEFLLPPKEKQAELADLLWAIDEFIEKDLVVSKMLDELKNIKLSKLLSLNTNKKTIFDIIKDFNGICFDGDWIESKDQSENGIKLIQLADIGIGKFLNKSERFISEETFRRLRCKEVKENDIIIARMPDPIGRSCIIPKLDFKSITAVDCCVIRIEDEAIRTYMNNFFNTAYFERLCNQNSSGTTRKRVSRKNLMNIEIPFNPKTILALNNEIDIILNTIKKIDVKIQSSKALQKSLINQVF
ncbi:restriction endonuclease subunit S [Elizabethkingia anophelis]|nr:restriction endonuclease subunit S [Elizabethkingia anophelis]MCT3812575.1 restriction endonuclease subunit S [Elizabethkingia anophelis]MCT3820088.1 restriction endonuclease subunit S [Elizabethkingia anophelis]